VPVDLLDPDEISRIDSSLVNFRQGDFFLGDSSFISLGRIRTDSGYAEQWFEVPVLGLILVSQSCDIVRSCAKRPVVEVCPLVEVDQEVLEQVFGWERPMYAAVPALRGQRLVADLDRTMTIEKAVVSGWTRTQGLTSDSEVREFARVLARKRQRFAFPDDFNEFVTPLRKRLIEKHGKESAEGNALRALEEIRVQAEPGWNAPQVQLIFHFVLKQDPPNSFVGRPWRELCDAWMKRLSSTGRFSNPGSLIGSYGSMTAAEYLQSDPLDLEYLSAGD